MVDLPPEKASCTHGWRGTRAGLEMVVKRSNPYPCRESNPGRLVHILFSIAIELSLILMILVDMELHFHIMAMYSFRRSLNVGGTAVNTENFTSLRRKRKRKRKGVGTGFNSRKLNELWVRETLQTASHIRFSVSVEQLRFKQFTGHDTTLRSTLTSN
jgi:hypothetical protein